jgi:16S rRNA (cytosine967-C5)-methyltransferase
VKNLDKRKTSAQNEKSKIQNRQISPARREAFEILLKIEREKAFSSILLPLSEEKLEAKDRALCHELTLGVLRKQIYIDRIVQKFIKSKVEKFDSEVLISLRLGIYQLLFLDKIPVFAAINESVNLVHRAKKKSATGLVNAVLRKVEREKIFQIEFADETEKVSAETSHPRWLIEHWSKSFGFEEASRIAKANNDTPQMVFRLTNKSDEKTIENLKKLGIEIEESTIVPQAWRVLKANEILWAYAQTGKIYFQEESSQLVAMALNLRRDESFLDVCAAPGSKTTLINHQSRMTTDKSPIYVGGDKYFPRLRVLRETCQRTGADNVQLAAYDAEMALPFADESFDGILVDAPCSGTGTIRHNPEIRYFLAAKDFLELPDKQLRILENASKVLKNGGRLIYSTCSLEIAENEAVIEKFLAKNQNFRKILLNLPGQFLMESGFARTYPHRDQTDGFFIAAFEKC